MQNTESVPRPASPRKSHPRILVFTGDGKGKTTAAMGMALRAAGHGLRTRIIQFLKNAPNTGEFKALQTFPHVNIEQVGKGFVPPPDHPDFPVHRDAALHGWKLAVEAIQGKQYDVIVLDEICWATKLGLIPEKDLCHVLQNISDNQIIALTGRGASPNIIALADTVTSMECIKHGMETGHKAQKGAEY